MGGLLIYLALLIELIWLDVGEVGSWNTAQTGLTVGDGFRVA